MTYATLIETDRVRVEWRGPHAFEVRAEAVRPGAPVPHVQGGTGPLREETTYGLLVQARGQATVAVRHPDPTVARGLQASSDGATVHGTLATRSQVGTLRLVVDVDGQPEVALVAEVVPVKVDRQTIERMRDEVEATVAGLALRYLRATVVPAAATPTPPTSGAGWLRLVEAALDALEPALAQVARAPRHDTERAVHLERADAIRHPDATLRQALRTGRGGGPQTTARGLPVRRRLPTRWAVLTLDTPEHRWLRAALDRAYGCLLALRDAEGRTRPSIRRTARLSALGAAVQRTEGLLRLEPLRAASRGAPPAPTLRLRRAAGYRAAYAAARVLRFGLDLGAGRLRVSLVDLFVLYELWATLAVVQALTGVLGPPLDPARLFAAHAQGLRLRLREGTPHTLRFALADGGTAHLAYQPRFGRPGLLPQRPDLLLTIERPGQPVRRYVLDAKYRRDDAPATVRRYGISAPPADALADLHRYRDAIRDRRGQRIIDEAVALYPNAPRKPGGVTASRLWASIETLGVGAVPLLPNGTQHLDAWLRRVLRDTEG